LKSNNIAAAKLYTGDTFIASEFKSADGIVWYKSDSSGYWSASSEKGLTLLKVTEIGDESNASNVPPTNRETAQDPNIAPLPPAATIESSGITSSTVWRAETLSGIASSSDELAEQENVNTSSMPSSTPTYDIINSKNYPVNRGSKEDPIYDYSTNIDNITAPGGVSGEAYLREIRENLNIYSAWSRSDINNKYHTEFNRFKLDHPDIFLRNTMGFIVFTRPDLNFLDDEGNLLDEISVDPRVAYIAKNNIHLVQSLTHVYDGKSGHNFNPFLSNLAQGIDVVDDAVDTLDTGETFTGYKFQYSKHNIKSISSGGLNIKFKETFDLGITNLFQLWVDYQSNVYRGVFVPKENYIWFRNIDYMCNIYYFLLDQDGETILFWSKYFGVFPTNVPKSSLAYDAGSQVQLPEMSVSFNYIYKEDLSPSTLVEFNKDAGVSNNKGITYLPTYNSSLGHSGKTWVGVPFVSSYYDTNGISANSYRFKLRFRSTKTMSESVSYGRYDAASHSEKPKAPRTASELSDRELVKQMAGLMDHTMEYLDKWDWSDELYRKAANAIRNGSMEGTSEDPMTTVQSATGFMDHTMDYIKKWDWGDQLVTKLANAMKNGM
jgi:hypothetical protein